MILLKKIFEKLLAGLIWMGMMIILCITIVVFSPLLLAEMMIRRLHLAQ